MNEVIPFQYEARQVRVVRDEDGEPWWVAKDVCEVLGYVEPSNAVKAHCKYAKLLKTTDLMGLKVPPRGLLIIPESDLYRLVIKSNLPKAQEFEEWIMEDVLPSIRKTGTYSTPRPKVPSLTPIAKELRAAVSMAKLLGFKGNQAILSANRVVKEVIGHDCMAIMGATHLISENQEIHLTASDLGKQFGLSGQKMNKLLKSHGFIESYRDHKNRLHWKPTEKGRRYTVLKDTGKKRSDGTPVQQMFYLESISRVIRPEVSNVA